MLTCQIGYRFYIQGQQLSQGCPGHQPGAFFEYRNNAREMFLKIMMSKIDSLVKGKGWL
jgi:hypothetical protein